MRFKFKVGLIGVLVVGILLAGGWWVWSNRPLPKVSPPPEAEATITTDKTEYKQGEKIKAELNFDGIIYEWGESGWSIQKLENNSWKDIFTRRGCDPLPDCKAADFEAIKDCIGYKLCERPIWYKIEKGGEGEWRTKWVWDQTKGEEKSYKCREVRYDWRGGEKVPIYGGIVDERCTAFELVSAGKYKIRFEYATAINPNDEFDRNVDIKYAEKEFTIEETLLKNPQTECLGTCRCMTECNKEGPLYFIPAEEGSSECSVNSANKTCCCSGV